VRPRATSRPTHSKAISRRLSLQRPMVLRATDIPAPQRWLTTRLSPLGSRIVLVLLRRGAQHAPEQVVSLSLSLLGSSDMSATESPTSEEFYCAVGRATTAWALVEDALFDLFSRLVTWHLTKSARPAGQSHFILGLVFYSSTNLRGRLDLLEKIIEKSVTEPDLLKEWKSIRNRVNTIYSRRSTLEHSHAWGSSGSLSILIPSIFAGSSKEMNYQQIVAAYDSFRRSAQRIENFAIAVNRHLVPTPSRQGDS
jgi:hypothetical protein